MKKTYILITAIIIITFITSIYLYPEMPEQMASHWNSKGEVDSYMSKFWGLFLMPIISLGIFLLLIFIPKIDPLKKNIEKFRKYYDGFMTFLIIFLLYIYILTILWNMGIIFNMTTAILPVVAILIYFSGILIEHSKRNWFIGIRTPWTISNEKVWNKTHKLGSKLFKIAAIIILIGTFIPKYAFALLLISVLIAAIYPIVYSYFEYKKEMKK